MATAGLLTLLDDVLTLTKRAAIKTSGVVGDDLALGANQVVGLSPARELPVIWRIFKGSLANKVVLVPGFIGLSALAPAAITPLLVAGGLYLSYEGAEKVIHKIFHKEDSPDNPVHQEKVFQELDSKAIEDQKVRGGILTDVILSAEVLVLSLGTMPQAALMQQAAVLSAIGLGMSLTVYGAVAGIVRIDDRALKMMAREGDGWDDKAIRAMGKSLLNFAPKFMKVLSVVGTGAMLAVGGDTIVHAFPALHHAIEGIAHMAGPVSGLAQYGLAAVLGCTAGLAAIPVVKTGGKAASWFAGTSTGKALKSAVSALIASLKPSKSITYDMCPQEPKGTLDYTERASATNKVKRHFDVTPQPQNATAPQSEAVEKRDVKPS